MKKILIILFVFFNISFIFISTFFWQDYNIKRPSLILDNKTFLIEFNEGIYENIIGSSSIIAGLSCHKKKISEIENIYIYPNNEISSGEKTYSKFYIASTKDYGLENFKGVKRITSQQKNNFLFYTTLKPLNFLNISIVPINKNTKTLLQKKEKAIYILLNRIKRTEEIFSLYCSSTNALKNIYFLRRIDRNKSLLQKDSVLNIFPVKLITISLKKGSEKENLNIIKRGIERRVAFFIIKMERDSGMSEQDVVRFIKTADSIISNRYRIIYALDKLKNKFKLSFSNGFIKKINFIKKRYTIGNFYLLIAIYILFIKIILTIRKGPFKKNIKLFITGFTICITIVFLLKTYMLYSILRWIFVNSIVAFIPFLIIIKKREIIKNITVRIGYDNMQNSFLSLKYIVYSSTIVISIGIIIIFTLLIISVFIRALYFERAYLSGLKIFSSVKLSYILPFIFYGLYIFTKKRTKINEYTKDIIILNILFLFTEFLIFIFAIALFRSGNTGAISSIETIIRNFFENIFYVRPRFKEILGWCFLYAYVIIQAIKGNYRKKILNIIEEFLIFSSLFIPVSIMNSFTHFHSTLIVTIIRAINGLITGIIISISIHVILIFVKKLLKRYFLNLKILTE